MPSQQNRTFLTANLEINDILIHSHNLISRREQLSLKKAGNPKKQDPEVRSKVLLHMRELSIVRWWLNQPWPSKRVQHVLGCEHQSCSDASWVGPLLRTELSLGMFYGGVDKGREPHLSTEPLNHLQFLLFRTLFSCLLSHKISPITVLSSLLSWSITSWGDWALFSSSDTTWACNFGSWTCSGGQGNSPNHSFRN